MKPLEEKELREKLGVVIDDLGRRSSFTAEDGDKIRKLRAAPYSLTMREIGDVMRCSTRTVQQVLRGER